VWFDKYYIQWCSDINELIALFYITFCLIQSLPLVVIVEEYIILKHKSLFGQLKAAVMVLKNGEMVATVWAESVPSWGTSSNVAVLQLTRGDRVWVSLLSRASYLHGYMYTTFSGIIVFDM